MTGCQILYCITHASNMFFKVDIIQNEDLHYCHDWVSCTLCDTHYLDMDSMKWNMSMLWDVCNQNTCTLKNSGYPCTHTMAIQPRHDVVIFKMYDRASLHTTRYSLNWCVGTKTNVDHLWCSLALSLFSEKMMEAQINAEKCFFHTDLPMNRAIPTPPTPLFRQNFNSRSS